MTFDELYSSHLDWILRTRPQPMGDLLDLTIESLDAMMETIVRHEKLVREAIERG